MLPTHAVGIDLGTTYSCIASLNEHGEPVTLPNRDGELSTPSAVLFDGDEVIVGTEALRNSIRQPDRVVLHAKRFMGDRNHRWMIGGKAYSPVDISARILKYLLDCAATRIGTIERAVITVPAQFSDVQRQATAEAGKKAGLKHVDIINEPVAAALCFVLGTEGIWFTELASTQQILVFDLGGGTLDLSLVRYQPNEVRVVASGGDLHLGGLDWNDALSQAICKQFTKEFNTDPRKDPESLQALALEVEQTKRSLSVRPRAALTCQHAGHRKTYQVEVTQFEQLTKSLVDRCEKITRQLLADNKIGWARVDVVLTTGGASRMPMVQAMLKQLSGRTLNTSLSPDQSIAHGATYYAGMLLTHTEFAKSILNQKATERLSQFRQHSVNARALGILVRDTEKQTRVPHYLLPPNTPLPTSVQQSYGTVIPNQRRVHLHIVESGTSPEEPYVELGTCLIEPLPENLPESSEIEVTISYDSQARVHVSAKEMKTGLAAQTEIVRPENLVVRAIHEDGPDAEVKLTPPVEQPKKVIPAPEVRKAAPPPTTTIPVVQSAPAPAPAPQPKPVAAPARAVVKVEESDQPIPLCNTCGEPLDLRGQCPACGSARRSVAAAPKPASVAKSAPAKPRSSASVPRPERKPAPKPPPVEKLIIPLDDDDELIVLEDAAAKPLPRSKPRSDSLPELPTKSREAGEDDFWKLME